MKFNWFICSFLLSEVLVSFDLTEQLMTVWSTRESWTWVWSRDTSFSTLLLMNGIDRGHSATFLKPPSFLFINDRHPWHLFNQCTIMLTITIPVIRIQHVRVEVWRLNSSETEDSSRWNQLIISLLNNFLKFQFSCWITAFVIF